MDTTSIINALRLERDRIDAAISALGGGTGGRSRSYAQRSSNVRRKPQHRLSAAARKRISEAAKARWAKAKRAGKTSL